MRHPLLLAVAVATSPLYVACADAPPSPDSTDNIELHAAALALTGVDFACYDLRIENGASPRQTVVSRGVPGQSLADGDLATLCSTQYGNGAGGEITFVAPCDASEPDHTVTIWVDGLYTGTPESPVAVPYQDPCVGGCALPATCAPNADTPVTFNLTILRPASQGFFDVAVNFDDIFCSAKVDCERAPGEPLTLLHDGDGERGQTAVLALACTGGPGAVDTVLYRDPITVTCGGVDTVLDPALGPGNVYGRLLTDPDPADAVWQYATYRGVETLDCGTGEGSCNKRYWNVAIGFDPSVAGCTLTTSMTAASEGTMTTRTPADTVYPWIDVAVELTAAVTGGLTCTSHALDDDVDVVTRYTAIDATMPFAAAYPALGIAALGCTHSAVVPTEILIPAGSYAIGCSATVGAPGYAAGCNNNTYPGPGGSPATLEAFYIDKYPATAAEYAAWCDAPGNTACTIDGSGDSTAAPANIAELCDRPANRVNWDRAEEYCAARGARLCTESEWEAAARGTDERQWPWGATSPTGCVYSNGVGCKPTTPGWPGGPGQITPVDAFPDGASPFGVMDLVGNISTWTSTPAPLAGTRILRGGNGTNTNANNQRTWYRFGGSNGFWPDLGVRCCRDAD